MRPISLVLTNLFYQLWSRRNAFIFQNQFSSPEALVRRAQADLDLYKEVKRSSQRSKQGPEGSSSNPKWNPPEWPFLKANFDAAFDKDKGTMGVGVVIRDADGSLQAVLTNSKENISSAAQAECVALLRAMEFCKELGLNHVHFEGDAKIVVEAVNSKKEDNSWLGQLIEDMQLLMKQNQAWDPKFIYRSANKAAHKAAQIASRFVCETIWLEKGPEEVETSVMGDYVISS